jgi:tetratricopeptide (TPR) repeat protein
MNVCRIAVSLLVISSLFVATAAHARRPQGSGGLATSPSSGTFAGMYVSPDVEVNVKGQNGVRAPKQTVAQLLTLSGQIYDELPVKNGHARFSRVPRNEFRVLVKAPGYQIAEGRVNTVRGGGLATVSLELRPITDAEEAAADRAIADLSPKTQKEIGKALEALRANQAIQAKPHLDAAQKQVPNNAEVEYLFGVYAAKMKDPAQAQVHWNRTLILNPNHLSALIEVGQDRLMENKPAEARPYLNRALEVEPSSWRVHALLAEADYLDHQRVDAIKEAERALELGHERAVTIQPLLARALAENGEKERAIQVLDQHLKARPGDRNAIAQREQLANPNGATTAAADEGRLRGELAELNTAATALPVPSAWMPPDVDEKMPAVETGACCALDEVVRRAGDQLVNLTHDVDRFTATEALFDESINKWGVAEKPERRTYDYVVSIQEIRPGHLGVEEYRNSAGKAAEFPDGVITSGLPALVMVFHPFYAGNYDMACEGLTRWNGAPAWQVHFRQRADKPMANRGFRMGTTGPSYAVALKGRAWIAADTYQIVRMETDLMKPVPQIRLVAEHTAIEYASVNFVEGNVKLWLPQTAEVYFDWNRKRVHRRHTFRNYMLFAVDENERIKTPKGATVPEENQPGNGLP